jgi:hypothetical protein
VREKASHTQRLQKTLEDANIKLDAVLTHLLGRSGRAINNLEEGWPETLSGAARRVYEAYAQHL